VVGVLNNCVLVGASVPYGLGARLVPNQQSSEHQVAYEFALYPDTENDIIPENGGFWSNGGPNSAPLSLTARVFGNNVGFLVNSPPFLTNSTSAIITPLPNIVNFGLTVFLSDGVTPVSEISSGSNHGGGGDTNSNGLVTFSNIAASPDLFLRLNTYYHGFRSSVPGCFAMDLVNLYPSLDPSLTTQFVLTLPATVKITVFVSDSEGPVSGAGVFVSGDTLNLCPSTSLLTVNGDPVLDASGNPQCMSENLQGQGGGCRSGSTLTDSNGYAVITVFADAAVTGSVVAGQGWRGGRSDTFLLASGEMSVSVTLPPNIYVSGTVLQSLPVAAAAADGADAAAIALPAANVALRTSLYDANKIYRSDAQGHFTVGPLASVGVKNVIDGGYKTFFINTPSPSQTFWLIFNQTYYTSRSDLVITLPAAYTHNVSVIDYQGNYTDYTLMLLMLLLLLLLLCVCVCVEKRARPKKLTLLLCSLSLSHHLGLLEKAILCLMPNTFSSAKRSTKSISALTCSLLVCQTYAQTCSFRTTYTTLTCST